MQLSEAIALGSVSIKWLRGGYYPPDGSHEQASEGCALDMAAVAIGRNFRGGHLREVWPWLSESNMARIANRFDHHVMRGTETFETFVDWVRSIEPAEETPAKQTEQLPQAQPVAVLA